MQSVTDRDSSLSVIFFAGSDIVHRRKIQRRLVSFEESAQHRDIPL
jgi:hypothetical protein